MFQIREPSTKPYDIKYKKKWIIYLQDMISNNEQVPS